jgi:hypothetical protein|tara:strand:+ start:98 stop:781 length:684 start_codon:yes stop_codon:yes gene_type:complete
MNKVAVLCRGKSLAGIEFLPEDIDLCILVNRFGDELKISKIGSYLRNKNIYQVLSRTPGEPDEMIKQKHFSEYNIKKMIQPYTIHMKNPRDFGDGNNRYYSFIDGKFYFCGEKGNPIPAEWLGDHHIPHMDNYQERYPHHYPSSGNAAVGYAVFDLNPKEVYVIGMDFYDVDYLADGGPGGPEDSYRMKESLSKIIDSKEEVKFTVITCGDYEKDKDNLEVIKLEEI